MFHILNFVQSLGACFTKSARKPRTAIEATNEILAQQMVLPSPSSISDAAWKPTGEVVIQKYTTREEKEVIDIIEAEMKWGISFFRDYSGYKIEDHSLSRIILSARYQKNPTKLRFVSCPKVIYAHDLGQEERDLLRIKLDAVVRSIPWNKLEERFQIKQDDWFIVSDVPERMQEELQKGL